MSDELATIKQDLAETKAKEKALNAVLDGEETAPEGVDPKIFKRFKNLPSDQLPSLRDIQATIASLEQQKLSVVSKAIPLPKPKIRREEESEPELIAMAEDEKHYGASQEQVRAIVEEVSKNLRAVRRPKSGTNLSTPDKHSQMVPQDTSYLSMLFGWSSEVCSAPSGERRIAKTVTTPSTGKSSSAGSSTCSLLGTSPYHRSSSPLGKSSSSGLRKRTANTELLQNADRTNPENPEISAIIEGVNGVFRCPICGFSPRPQSAVSKTRSDFVTHICTHGEKSLYGVSRDQRTAWRILENKMKQ